LGAACAGVAACLGGNILGLTPLLIAGGAEVKEELLPQHCSGPNLAAFCLTEAEAGSDVGSLRTTARRVGDGYVIEGYRPIIAGGENIWHVHYALSNCPLRDGDLVLMDVAPECNYYTSDIGRMWPINGTYAPWQRELYGYIVEYHQVVLSKIRTGVTPDQVMDEAAEEMKEVWANWEFSKDFYKEGARRTLEFRGHLSHPVGMAVHDDGRYHHRPLMPGTVFSVDPQMWIPEEQLYIGVEDTVVVTNDGIEPLTSDAPLELSDVEALMRDEGTQLPYLLMGARR